MYIFSSILFLLAVFVTVIEIIELVCFASNKSLKMYPWVIGTSVTYIVAYLAFIY